MKTSDRVLMSFQQEIESHRPEILDRDLAEVLLEIQFLLDQIASNIAGYSQADLEKATLKVSLLRRKAEIARLELRKRGNR